MATSTTDEIPGVEFSGKKYTLRGWKNKNDPTQHLRGGTYQWRIEDSRGNTKLKFDMEAGYTVTNSEGEVIAKIGDHIAIDEVTEEQVGSGEVVYSPKSDEILLAVDMKLTGGGKVTRYDSGDTLLTLESSRLRQFLSVVPVADFVFNELWEIKSPKKGHVCTASENRQINPLSKPSKSIKIQNDTRLSDIEKFGILCMIAKLSLS